MEKGVVTQVLIMVAIAGVVCFGAGYLVAGGTEKIAEQYTYGENIDVHVSIPKLGINEDVQLYKGMTPFDALLRVTSMKTEYYESMGASMVTEIGGQESSWGYEVNGETPVVGMQDYQLRDGDNLEIIELW
jgi:hypothetical protein